MRHSTRVAKCLASTLQDVGSTDIISGCVGHNEKLRIPEWQQAVHEESPVKGVWYPFFERPIEIPCLVVVDGYNVVPFPSENFPQDLMLIQKLPSTTPPRVAIQKDNDHKSLVCQLVNSLAEEVLIILVVMDVSEHLHCLEDHGAPHKLLVHSTPDL